VERTNKEEMAIVIHGPVNSLPRDRLPHMLSSGSAYEVASDRCPHWNNAIMHRKTYKCFSFGRDSGRRACE
jgi:hypothetical protein